MRMCFVVIAPIGQKASAVLEVFLCLIRRDAIASVSIVVASVATSAVAQFLCIHWNCSSRVFHVMLVKESLCFVIFDNLSRTQSRTEKYTFSFVVLPAREAYRNFFLHPCLLEGLLKYALVLVEIV